MERGRTHGKGKAFTDRLSLLMPWWAWVGLAVASYALLHFVVAGAQASATVATWHPWAIAAQYVVPGVCVVAAAWFELQRRPAVPTADSAVTDAMQGVTAECFAQQVAEGFRRRGYLLPASVGGMAMNDDDGWVVARHGERSLVQCAHWKATKVDVPAVQNLFDAMTRQEATGGFLVTSGRFTQHAVAFASGRRIRLIDGAALVHLLREAPKNTRPWSDSGKDRKAAG